MLCLIVLLHCVTFSLAQQNGPDFTKHIAPIFNKYCVGCHNPQDKEGEVSLESFHDLQKGGSRGPLVIAGLPDSSRLIRVLTGQAEPAMPPEDNEGPKPAEIQRLKEWVAAGAVGPNGEQPEQRRILVPEIQPTHDLAQPITALAYSPDGRHLAVARFGEVELLAADNLHPARLFGEHPGKVNAVEFTSDGKYLIAASGIAGLYGEARIWNVADGQLVRAITGHRDTLYAALPSPDGRLLATAGYDHQIILWEMASGEQHQTLKGHNGAVYDLAFSPDGRVLASASADETIKLWNVQTGQRLDTLGQPLKEQYAVAFSPDGQLVVAGGVDNRIRVWQLFSRDKPQINPIRFARFAHEGPVVQLAFSPDGQRLVSVGEDRTVKVWETDTFTELRIYENQPDVTPALAVSPTGHRFAVGRADGSLQVYPIESSDKQDDGPITAQLTTSIPRADMASMSQAEETEPNDTPSTATCVTAPGQFRGVVHAERDDKAADVDFFRFASQAGQMWRIEVDAENSSSPLDSHVEVLQADGRPILRMLLQAVRDSYVTFRGGSSTQNGVRLHNWEEMELNEYLYRKGEVNRFFRMPQGPDSDMLMYTSGGARRCYFDTTATTYAIHEPCYIVEPHPPGTRLVPNGLPVFPVYFENDDDGLRERGTGSCLTFVAPAGGQYLVRVSDVRGTHGEAFKYQLTIRPPKPDFEVTLHDINPTVSRASGKELRVSVKRIDGFEGQIRVRVDGVPPGFTVTSPIVIQAGHDEAFGMIYATESAAEPAGEIASLSKVTASALVDGRLVTKPVNNLGEITLGPSPKLRVLLSELGVPPSASQADNGPLELVITPGETITADLHLQRLDFEDRVSFDVRNLPHGVIVDNIGLNGVLIPEGQQRRTIYLTAAKWVSAMERTFFLKSREDGGQTSLPVVLQVRPHGSAP